MTGSLYSCVFLSFFSYASILPAAEYTTFIGDANHYKVARVLADSEGNTYIAGTRLLAQTSDVFLIKLDSAGHTLLFRDISGKGSDVAADMAIDPAGNIYIGGSTTSFSFPLRNAFQSTPGPGFIIKLNGDASQPVWATYFREAITALAVDASGSVYVTGSTVDPQFPVTPGLPNGPPNDLHSPPVEGAFLAKFGVAGDRRVYSTVISGSSRLCGSACFGFTTRQTVGCGSRGRSSRSRVPRR